MVFENFSLLKTAFPGRSSVPTSFVSFFVFFFFSYLLLKTMGCFSGCLTSFASIHKLFCRIYSAFKCSFDEFVREKVVSPSYSSAILGSLPPCFLNSRCLIAHKVKSKYENQTFTYTSKVLFRREYPVGINGSAVWQDMHMPVGKLE